MPSKTSRLLKERWHLSTNERSKAASANNRWGAEADNSRAEQEASRWVAAAGNGEADLAGSSLLRRGADNPWATLLNHRWIEAVREPCVRCGGRSGAPEASFGNSGL